MAAELLTHALVNDIAYQYSKSGPDRLYAMGKACWRIDEYKIPGDIVECGVWRGGNIILARKICPSRMCWLFDTYSGMTEPEDVDRKRSGRLAKEHRKPPGEWSAVSLENVRGYMQETGTLDDKYLRFVEGRVEDTLLDSANLPDEIAILRLDTDWHASTKVELEVLYPRLVNGGYLIVDDYGHWMGARKAVDDYFSSSLPDWHYIDYSCVIMQK